MVAISDNYAVQYLLEGTQSEDPRIVWQEQESSGYIALVEGVEILLERVHSRTESHLALRFTDRTDQIYVHEPHGMGWFGRQYASEDERTLAEMLQRLMDAVLQQCKGRRERAICHPGQVKERLYRRLLFEPANLQERQT
jgi:hypothetical protein